jgi:hypothetical protein
MKAPDEQRPRLDRDAQDFVRRIADAWAPAEMSAAERTRFDARLAERLERGRGRRVPWRVAAGAAGAAVGLLLARWRPWLEPSGPVAAAPAGDAELILAFAREPEAGEAADAELPDDYQAIAALLAER